MSGQQPTSKYQRVRKIAEAYAQVLIDEWHRSGGRYDDPPSPAEMLRREIERTERPRSYPTMAGRWRR